MATYDRRFSPPADTEFLAAGVPANRLLSAGPPTMIGANLRHHPQCEKHVMTTMPKIYLARHGETAWSLSGQHTGRTDIPLTERGEQNAVRLGDGLHGVTFAQVLTSPLVRARRTCELAGFGAVAQPEPDLLEWDYGAYEGKRTVEIKQERPGWFLFRDGVPGGESVDDVRQRADRLIVKLRQLKGNTLLFSHGHFLRVLGARWLGLAAGEARHFLLGTCALSILTYEHGSLDEPVLALWNDQTHVRPD